MAALTEDRNTLCKKELYAQGYKAAADAVHYEGALVGLGAGGYSIPAADSAACVRVAGVARKQVDNTGGNDGDVAVPCGKGVYAFANGAGINALNQADIEQLCYVVDDQTVGRGTNFDVIAGKLLEIDAAGRCWVEVGMVVLDTAVAS